MSKLPLAVLPPACISSSLSLSFFRTDFCSCHEVFIDTGTVMGEWFLWNKVRADSLTDLWLPTICPVQSISAYYYPDAGWLLWSAISVSPCHTLMLLIDTTLGIMNVRWFHSNIDLDHLINKKPHLIARWQICNNNTSLRCWCVAIKSSKDCSKFPQAPPFIPSDIWTFLLTYAVTRQGIAPW